MELLVDTTSTTDLRELTAAGVRADYVYSYPPRQAYRSFTIDEVEVHATMQRALSRFQVVNLYIHFPFCAQICNFCNLYTTTANGSSPLDDYISAVTTELRQYRSALHGKLVRSVYLGGGTPSLFSARQLQRVLKAIEHVVDRRLPADIEVAIEVDPATVDVGKLRAFHTIGINRINLGYQSTNDNEIVAMGRNASSERSVSFIAQVLAVGFDNVCVDLIYGLEGQTDQSWCRAVKQVIELRPNTICAYCLTPRPFTPYWMREYRGMPSDQTYVRYDTANELLLAAGYTQETPVRWITDGGGYRQKRYHWAMENVLGIGAGARSYLWDVDARNGYSVRNRRRTLQAYLTQAAKGIVTPTDGLIMDDNERRRKAVILGLIDLDRSWYSKQFGVDPLDDFPDEFRVLYKGTYANISERSISLTSLGRRHRDLLVQLFFSDHVKERLRTFTYDE